MCRWEFDKGNQSLAVGVNGPLIIGDMHMTIRTAMDGMGGRSVSFSIRESLRSLIQAESEPRGLVFTTSRLILEALVHSAPAPRPACP